MPKILISKAFSFFILKFVLSLTNGTTYQENEKINLPAVKFSRTGFEFLNWNTAADGSGTAYADGAEFTFNTDTMLHAQWK